jgi:hypothetical protein
MAANGSQWQFLGRAPSFLTTLDAIQNEFSSWLTISDLRFTDCALIRMFCGRGGQIRGERSCAYRPHRSALTGVANSGLVQLSILAGDKIKVLGVEARHGGRTQAPTNNETCV